MVIYTVQPGDTVYSIAQKNNTTPSRIIIDNDLTNPGKLSVGQALVLLYPTVTYTVRGGDTLLSIARAYGVTLMELWQNNPALRGRTYIYPGQTLNIAFERPPLGKMWVNGYAYPYIDRSVLRTTLPFLTYLSIFSYGYRRDGSLIPPTGGDEELIALAKEYRTVPIMVLTSLNEQGLFSQENVIHLLTDAALQQTVIDNIMTTLQTKGYGGVDIDFEYIPREYEEAFVRFLEKLKQNLASGSYTLTVSLAPKTDDDQKGLLYEGLDYESIGMVADNAFVMTYEWGYTYGPPMAVSPIHQVRHVLDYAVTEIPPEKITMGMPNYGYDWALPYVRGESAAVALSNVAATHLAADKKAAIRFDELSQSPTFTYFEYSPAEGKNIEHEVWFEDARSVDAQLRLVREYGLMGISVWQIMKYFPQLWLVLHSLYETEKLI